MTKRKKPVPYTAMTKELFRDNGYTVEDVERTNCWNGHKNDLFGFGDLLAVKLGKPVTIIQSTSGSNHTARVKKILGLPQGKKKGDKVLARTAELCLMCGMEILVVSWKKIKNRWTPRIERIGLTDF